MDRMVPFKNLDSVSIEKVFHTTFYFLTFTCSFKIVGHYDLNIDSCCMNICFFINIIQMEREGG